jgi:hypothetical protein
VEPGGWGGLGDDPEWSGLETVLEVASRCGDGPEAVAARIGRPLDNARTLTVRDGVAVVPVVGPLFRRARLPTQISVDAIYEPGSQFIRESRRPTWLSARDPDHSGTPFRHR